MMLLKMEAHIMNADDILEKKYFNSVSSVSNEAVYGMTILANNT